MRAPDTIASAQISTQSRSSATSRLTSHLQNGPPAHGVTLSSFIPHGNRPQTLWPPPWRRSTGSTCPVPHPQEAPTERVLQASTTADPGQVRYPLKVPGTQRLRGTSPLLKPHRLCYMPDLARNRPLPSRSPSVWRNAKPTTGRRMNARNSGRNSGCSAGRASLARWVVRTPKGRIPFMARVCRQRIRLARALGVCGIARIPSLVSGRLAGKLYVTKPDRTWKMVLLAASWGGGAGDFLRRDETVAGDGRQTVCLKMQAGRSALNCAKRRVKRLRAALSPGDSLRHPGRENLNVVAGQSSRAYQQGRGGPADIWYRDAASRT